MKCNCKNRTGIKPNILSQTLVCALVWNMAHFIQLKKTAAVIGETLWNPNKYFRFQFMNVIYYTVTIQVSVSARFTPPLKYLDLFNTKSKRLSYIVTSFRAFSFYRYLRESWDPILNILISFSNSRLNIGNAIPF